ncbi:MarR family transcriptional regulator [Amycolatopsis sp. SID8362]|uniref:MarR family winged helix-turn-helix transcriptional regulator n=1 Tax=Amycolatopsis sp. SID8362 TaxID=2690346 RepID=UPI00136CACD5|nr:MarR family transcriptional regulator [Amycolatopsis sp. SID8362]NBH05566.1 MarR family transcriptional regulator [Amycolatopsis sp. SID8362]NED42266.1 MarR family transcriptional regulator [Amycolatopsis sp. SID8362]
MSLSRDHDAAWRGFLRSSALLLRVLDAELRAEHGMSHRTYDALVQLSEAPDRRLRMKDLADALVHSASGLTRIVDGLESSGYARREPDPANRRSTLVVLTPAGLAALEAAWPTHVRGVERHFAEHVSRDQARVLAEVFRGITADLD